MEFVAFIPARGGSKSIPRKNIKPIAGKPLIHWVVEAALNAGKVERVYVSTDSADIEKTVNQLNHPKLSVIGRSPETATDTASTESVLLEFARQHTTSNIILLQATSPLTTSEDIDEAIALFQQSNADSLVSCVRQKRFIWRRTEAGIEPVNYNPLNRPRRQDFDGFLVENGAIYITRKHLLLSSGCRISGRTIAYEMAEETYFELDEPSDWTIIESFLMR